MTKTHNYFFGQWPEMPWKAAKEEIMPKTFRRPMLKVVVYDNRVEVTKGMIPFRKKRVIPFRNIANVEVTQFTKHLIIHTNDGKKHKYQFGAAGLTANRVREAIEEAL